MLKVIVTVNDEVIDTIHIHNTKIRDNEHTLYKIKEPAGLETWSIWHDRTTGYEPLLRKALRVLIRERVRKNKE